MIYYVTFQTQKNRVMTYIMFHCEAKNAKEACAIAKQAWTERGRTEHQFHLYAHKSRIQDQTLLGVIDWKGGRHNGVAVMDRFIATDAHFMKRR